MKDRKRTLEERLVKAILGRDVASALMTDAYKFSMAQAGFPRRHESFYLCFRRQGAWFNPFDLVHVINLFRPESLAIPEQGFALQHGYAMNGAMEKSLKAPIAVHAIPKGAWFGPLEPIVRVHTESFLASWLEPNVIRLQFPLQVATAILTGVRDFTATCADEAEIIRICAEAVNVDVNDLHIQVREREYRVRVRRAAREVRESLGGSLERAFEVGMRGAVCEQQHRIALEECKAVGFTKTSNMYLAWLLYMQPVGTTGHEHQMRHGPGDIRGFQAIRDCRSQMPSYLFDTEEPLLLGIPAAVQAMLEWPDRPCSVRFDSGDQDAQFELLLRLTLLHALTPTFIFEDGYTAAKTGANERFLEGWNFPKERAWYGYGGYLITKPAFSPYTRDVVSAAYKLCLTTENPVMKWSGTPGKESAPGRVVSYTRVPGEWASEDLGEYDRLIAQEGEEIRGFIPLDSPRGMQHARLEDIPKVGKSPQTNEIVEGIRADRAFRIQAAQEALANAATAGVC